ncbi:hypothetical protein ES319_D08G105700v1 [Gossypium barbadense]|uniref:Prolamin-like domain-containing protein n=1 Tax=Gossypium barbadense TaxID=3634 RepID=A0A5J5QBX1_GOSBA|nr:hypothetical protein ES319_D08G105700v1 [Gossypium barbadense]
MAIFACELAIILAAIVAYNDLDVADTQPSSAVADDTVALSIWDEAQQLEDLYQRCTVILGDECEDEIYDLIFRNDSFVIISHKYMELIVSKNCCGKVDNMGRRCHDHMVNMIAQTTGFFSHLSPTLPRSSQVWGLCSLNAS